MREESSKGMRCAWALALIAAAFALGSCGSGGDPPATSVIKLTSPDIGSNGATKPGIQCGYGPIWITLEWGEVPKGAKELAIYYSRFKYVKDGNERKPVLTYADLLNNIDPSLRRMTANTLPPGVNWSSFGDSCKTQQITGERLLAQVFALEHAKAPREMGRELATQLTEEALADPNPQEGPRSPGKLTGEMTAVGRLFATDGPPRE